ncbi:MAG: 23S rRNA (pseudouridine(1915)-N(3))-methyltransferase RlmH [Ferruginibacter sp.]
MKLQFWTIGKAHETYVKEGIEIFTKRISNYYPIQWNIIPMPKNAGIMAEPDLKAKEGEIIMSSIKKEDYLIVLDERGKQMNSEGLAAFLQQRGNESEKNIIFLIGGAYGLSNDVLQRANYKWSLSQLVFPHQLVRLLLAEQIYRACSILRNEKYHHS